MKPNFEPVIHQAKVGRYYIRIEKNRWYADVHKFMLSRATNPNTFDVGRTSKLTEYLFQNKETKEYSWGKRDEMGKDYIYAWFDTFDDAVAAIPSEEHDPIFERRNQVVLLRDQGLTFKEIGIKIGVSASRANQLFTRAKQNA